MKCLVDSNKFKDVILQSRFFRSGGWIVRSTVEFCYNDSYFIMKVDGNNNLEFFCPIILSVYFFFTFFLTCASLLTITAITVDRLLWVILHLRYHELVTTRRVAVLLVLLWVISIAAAFTIISFPKHSEIVNLLWHALQSFLRLAHMQEFYKVVKHHRIQIAASFNKQVIIQ